MAWKLKYLMESTMLSPMRALTSIQCSANNSLDLNIIL